jgi:uncharacterized OB-fold protein
MNKVLESILKMSGMTLEEVRDRFINGLHGYEWYEPLVCDKCGTKFYPFFFGDKPMNREVMQDCPKCDNNVSFNPSKLKMKDENNTIDYSDVVTRKIKKDIFDDFGEDIK